jgi:hypothetical protein
MIGQTLDHYRILAQIGEGGWSAGTVLLLNYSAMTPAQVV